MASTGCAAWYDAYDDVDIVPACPGYQPAESTERVKVGTYTITAGNTTILTC